MANKRNPKNWCKCGNYAKQSKSGKCRKCYWREIPLAGDTKTLKELNSTYARHKYQLVRKHATTVMKRLGIPRICNECGYDKHVEICHIKAISEFAENATFTEINSKLNLVYLCPNHHWELDNL
jgi:hypothetical protein